jgi:hypothetical protein
VQVPAWAERSHSYLYVLFMNRLYLDELYTTLGRAVMRAAYRLDRWSFGRTS